jgi:hypothetical protein
MPKRNCCRISSTGFEAAQVALLDSDFGRKRLLRQLGRQSPYANVFSDKSPNIHVGMREKNLRKFYTLKYIMRLYQPQPAPISTKFHSIMKGHQPMSQETAAAPPPLPVPNVKPKRKWGFLKIALIVVVGVIFFLKILGSSHSLDLEATRKGYILADDESGVEIVNVGTTPVTITKIIINDRNDCTIVLVGLLADPNGRPSLPIELKVGDKLAFGSSCRIIRANIQTADASETYSF